MKTLLKPYLESKGIQDSYPIINTRISFYLASEDGKYKLVFPVWRYDVATPTFSHEEIESALKEEMVAAKLEGLERKYSNDLGALDQKRAELLSKTTVQEINDYEI